MPQHVAAGWSRREFLDGAALLALALGVPVAALGLSERAEDAAPSERQRHLIREVSQLVVPRSDTPGAGDVGVGAFVVLALAHGLESSRAPSAGAAAPQLARHRRRDGSLRHLGWLEHELDRRAGGDFLARSPGERSAALASLDGEAYAEGVREHPWGTLKALILTGYYTSEAGASQELRYELVPGRYDRDLPLTPGDRAWSSDWTAVEFG